MQAGWTVAGVLAHLAFWDQRVVVLVDRWADGRGTPPPTMTGLGRMGQRRGQAALPGAPPPGRGSDRGRGRGRGDQRAAGRRRRSSPPTRRPASPSACGAPNTGVSTWTRSSRSAGR